MSVLINTRRISGTHTFALVSLFTGVIRAINGPGSDISVDQGCDVMMSENSPILVIEFNPEIKPYKVGDEFDFAFGITPPGGISISPALQGQAGALMAEGVAHAVDMTDLLPGTAAFAFDLGSRVRIGESKVMGTVRARLEDLYAPNRYFIQYSDDKGMPREDYYEEDQLAEVIDGDQSDGM